jgi:hypothetical protein
VVNGGIRPVVLGESLQQMAKPVRFRDTEVRRVIRAFRHATGASDVLVTVNSNGSFSIRANTAIDTESNPFEVEAERLRHQGQQEQAT